MFSMVIYFSKKLIFTWNIYKIIGVNNLNFIFQSHIQIDNINIAILLHN